jgi:tetratricopeptide (TPR) repeat protein
MTCPDENTLLAFTQRLLKEEEVTSLEAHLRDCSHCRQIVAALMRAQSSGDHGASPGTPPGYAERAALQSPEEPLAAGSHLGRYILLRPIGAGGMGVVFAAYDSELDRTVALKLLQGDRVASEEAQARLQREARAMARLTSPYVLPVYDVGAWQGQVFVTMELVQGGTLTRWLRERSHGWREVLTAFLDAGWGLAAAHAAGLVHRDFKPDNVLIGADGRIRVTDFGLARSLAAPLPPVGAGGIAHAGASTSGLTQQGAVLGTPAYMSPEQLAGLPVDARSDQFSFCVALYEALYGERPFAGDTSEAMVSAVRGRQVRTAPAGTRVPAWVRQAILRGLSPEPEARHPSMEALLAVLEADPASRRRRGLMVAGTVGLVLLAVGITHEVGERRSQVCQGAEGKLAGIWDEPTRRAVEQALLATGKPHAANVWRSVAAWLDQYSGQWVAAHVEACEATRVKGEQSEQALDLRMGCLERRRKELGAFTKLLGEKVEDEVLDRALPAAQGLVSVDGCADVEALRARPLLPEGEPRRSQAEALRQRLAEIQALTSTGQYVRALAIAKEALGEAKSLGFAPLEAETLINVGVLQERTGDKAASAKTLLAGVLAAHAADRPELASDGYIELVFTSQEQPEEALRWGQFASALVTAIGDPPQLRARLLNNEAFALQVKGELPAAYERLKQSAVLWERALGPDNPQLAVILSNMGIMLQQLGRSSEAIPLVKRALSIEERTMGPDYSGLAATLDTLAGNQITLGEYAAGRESASRALSIVERSLGPEHPWVPAVLNTLGAALSQEGRSTEALEAFQRSLALFQKLQGPEDPAASATLINIAEMLNFEGRYAEAFSHAERAHLLFQKALGPGHARLADSLNAMGNALLGQGQVARAMEHYQRALAIREKALGPDSMFLGHDLRGIARCWLELRQPAKALAPLERALRLQQDAAPTDLADTQFILAKALGALGQEPARARALAEEARARLSRAGPRHASLLAEVDTWLASHPSTPRP